MLEHKIINYSDFIYNYNISILETNSFDAYISKVNIPCPINLADKIYDFYCNRNKYIEQANKDSMLIKEKFNINKIGNDLLNILNKILSK